MYLQDNNHSNNSFEENYILDGKNLGNGGNANVKKVIRKVDGAEFAIKILKEESKQIQEKILRFQDEIKIMYENAPLVEGILPILDYSNEECWYVMPVAESIKNHIQGDYPIEKIVDGIIELSETLIELHAKGLSHRDIKPDNIFFFKNRYYLGDFGLVDIPDNPKGLTKNGDRIGAKYTIAPEMFRNTKTADGKKADVYSLAKTLWMLLKKDYKGFDGRYDFMDKSISLHSHEELNDIHLVEIDELLGEATKNAPEDRPTMSQFKDKLKAWKETYINEKKIQYSNWNFINKYLFNNNLPSSCSWTNIESIVYVLNLIGSLPAYNYMMFSDGGGLDFQLAKMANEKGCIYVYASNMRFLVKPRRLCLEVFDESEWNYFLLELEEQAPILDEVLGLEEHLVEDVPGHYVSAQFAQYGVYDYDSGEKLPQGYKIVHRYLGGKFLIVLKFGPYNKIVSATDGRHGDCSNFEFKEYMDLIKHTVEEKEAKGFSRITVLNSVFCKNPFKKEELPEKEEDTSGIIRIPPNFIKENYNNFCFDNLVNEYISSKKGKVAFYYEFHSSDTFNFNTLFGKKKLYLCKDGYIRSVSKDDENIFMIYDRDSAIEFSIKLEKELARCCNVGEEVYLGANFDVSLQRIGKPLHLFSKNELKDLMRNADDRKSNTIVIDGDGYACIVNEAKKALFYPVRNETWISGNNYVGKYSELGDLNETYLYLLESWLTYLETNTGAIFQDYVSYSKDENTLISEIEKYY